MLLLVTCDEDGDIRLQFFPDSEAAGAAFGEHAPKRWLTADEAAGDPNYWPSDSAFLAEVTPVRLEPKEVAVRWQVTRG